MSIGCALPGPAAWARSTPVLEADPMRGPPRGVAAREATRRRAAEASRGASAGSPARAWVGTYRSLVAPAWAGRCRFAPTCSRYGEVVLAEHGIGGLPLVAARLLRCQDEGAARRGGAVHAGRVLHLDLPPSLEPSWDALADDRARVAWLRAHGVLRDGP